MHGKAGNLTDNVVGIALLSDILHDKGHAYPDVGTLSVLLEELLRQSGLGIENSEAPLADIIKPGMTVLVKPNWVLHENYSGAGLDCLVTHPVFLLALLGEIFRARPGQVVIGDAPIQGCDFNALVPDSWRKAVRNLATCPVQIVDFRRTKVRMKGLTEGQDRDIRPAQRYVRFDLQKDSLLEQVSVPGNRFRITMYDPDHLAVRHKPGRHQYLLCREPFEADVILNLPKLKTHKKAGITAALKNVVGLNGNKEYLPHHRVGGTADGGDCYPGYAPLKRVAEFCLDEANRNIGTETYPKWIKRSQKLLGLQCKFGNGEIEGGWYGNDTVWRMTLDLNRILLYGRADGTMSDTPMRKIYSITDGIIAGEGEGPLAPIPVYLGIVTFASSSVFADLVHSSLMGFDPEKISLVREAFGNYRYPLTALSHQQCVVSYKGKTLSLLEAEELFGKFFIPPRGWKDHIENRRSRA